MDARHHTQARAESKVSNVWKKRDFRAPPRPSLRNEPKRFPKPRAFALAHSANNGSFP